MQRTPLKNQEYIQNSDPLGNAEHIAEGVCVFSGCYGSAADGGYTILMNLGDTICYALEEYISEELDEYDAEDLLDSSGDVRLTALIAAEQALDDLLGEFIEKGYQTGMEERLQKVVNAARTQLEIDAIWVLPGDLDDLVERVHPLTDYDAYRSDEEAEANEPPFDLHNPEHCAALEERLRDLSC